MTWRALERMDTAEILNKKTDKDSEIGEMLPETRVLLDDFYRPCNYDLARLLDDGRYLWMDIN